MTTALDALEQRLIAGYEQQLRQYDRALAVVDARACLPNAADVADWANDVEAILTIVSELDAGIGADKTAWRESGQHPGPRLQELVELIRQRIEWLIETVNGRAADLETRKARLLPDIDTFIQKRRMLQAYGT